MKDESINIGEPAASATDAPSLPTAVNRATTHLLYEVEGTTRRNERDRAPGRA